MITSYQRGYKKELEFVRKLKKTKRFHTVLRSAGSRSPFDVVALSGSRILLVQVKTGKGKFKRDIKKLKKLKVPSCAKKQVWVYDNGWRLVFDE